MNAYAITLAFFIPWIIFCLSFALMSFHIHYQRPTLAWLLFGACAALVGFVGIAATIIFMRKRNGDYDHAPSWIIFMFITMALALMLGTSLGYMNFWTFMQPYYDLTNLSHYTGVNPATMRGQQLMDAGQVTFAEGAQLDLSKSMGFQNLDTYCVAPITFSNEGGSLPLASYDFWAVGLDCCSGNNADFHCGEFNNPNALSGLRLMNDNQRSFYRLAVQQAEAAYNVRATHPLFFYWMENPTNEVTAYKEDGYKYYFLGMVGHFFFQLAGVVTAVSCFSKMSHF